MVVVLSKALTISLIQELQVHKNIQTVNVFLVITLQVMTVLKHLTLILQVIITL